MTLWMACPTLPLLPTRTIERKRNRMLRETFPMKQTDVSIPEELVPALDAVAARLGRTRAEVVVHALESYLEDFDDISVAMERLNDPSEQPLDWYEVRNALLNSDKSGGYTGHRKPSASREV